MSWINFRLLLLVAPCWMEGLGFPQFSTCWNTFLISVPLSCCRCFCRLGAQGSAIAAFTLWLLRDVCCTDKGSLPQSVRHLQDDSCIYNNSLPTVLERIDMLVSSKGWSNSATSAPKLADSLLHLFRVGLAWYTIGIYHSVMKYLSSFSLEQNSGCSCRQAFIHYCGLHQVWARTEKLCLIWVLRGSMSIYERFYAWQTEEENLRREHAQNLLGGVKREVGKLTLGGNVGLYYIILNWITYSWNTHNIILKTKVQSILV